MTPQGTLCEKLRAGGAGIPGYYTRTGFGTDVEEGGFPIKFGKDGKVLIASERKERKTFNGKEYILEPSITGEFSFIKAWRADEKGNIQFRKSARNYNPDCAVAGRICIAEVEEIVPVGTIDPDQVHLPDVYVKRIVKSDPSIEKKIERRTTSDMPQDEALGKGETRKKREKMAKRAALELKDGMYVNLGIGVPTECANHLKPGVNITL